MTKFLFCRDTRGAVEDATFLMRVGNDVRRRGSSSILSAAAATARAAAAGRRWAYESLCPAHVGWVWVGLAEGKASGFSSEERVGLGQAWGVAGRSQ